MPQTPGDKESRSWKTVATVILVVAVAAVAWWTSARGGDERVSFPAICTQCGDEQTVKVGDAPGQEQWPRECPRCHAKHLYMATKCEKCRKLIPFKDPNAEKFGLPVQCPSCKRPVTGS
jgi:hypothetical protein